MFYCYLYCVFLSKYGCNNTEARQISGHHFGVCAFIILQNTNIADSSNSTDNINQEPAHMKL